MNYPMFYDEVAHITLRDPLAETLGAAKNGLMTYGYLDAVKLAGHSCPTVAGAYLMTLKALRHLYPDTTPERGAVRIDFATAQAEGVTGVTAAVVGLLTGAAGEGGFKGLGGHFSRKNLLHFASDMDSEIRFTRLDTGAGVDVSYQPSVVPPLPRLQALMQKLLAGEANAEEHLEFGQLWQMRVRQILIDHFDDAQLVVCREVSA